ncbi:MAG: aminoacyl-tRNA hydrolase [Candidatus Dojkabacteria bacterium]
MFLIVGLGNVGKEYIDTPHNSGFLFLDILRERLLDISSLQVSEWINEKKLFQSEICKIKRDGEVIFLLQKPLTYMNRSGDAVRMIVEKFAPKSIILAHDDLDILLGRYKIGVEKSPKGHRGVLSVEEGIGRKDFLRVRIGVDNRGEREIPGEEYVLQRCSDAELSALTVSVKNAVEELLSTFEL